MTTKTDEQLFDDYYFNTMQTFFRSGDCKKAFLAGMKAADERALGRGKILGRAEAFQVACDDLREMMPFDPYPSSMLGKRAVNERAKLEEKK